MVWEVVCGQCFQCVVIVEEYVGVGWLGQIVQGFLQWCFVEIDCDVEDVVIGQLLVCVYGFGIDGVCFQ